MDSYVLVLAASSGKNLALAQRFSESFEKKGSAKIVDLTTLHWPVYTPELDGDRDKSPDTSELSSLILTQPLWLFVLLSTTVLCLLHSTTRLHGSPSSRMIFENVQQSNRFARNTQWWWWSTLSDGYAPPILFLGSNVIGRSMTLNKSKPFSQETMDDLIQRALQ